MRKKRSIRTKDLIPGMIIAENVYTANDQLIVSPNTAVTDKLITRLDFYSIIRVSVWEDVEPPIYQEDFSKPYSQRIQGTKDFKDFKQVYENTTSDFTEILNNIVEKNTSPAVINEILEQTTKMITNRDSNLFVFDMLHNMRELDDSTFVHSLNVALIATVLGRWIHWPEDELTILTLCGLFHDIGKLAIPKSILTKPGRLDQAEYNIIKTHPVQGYELLKTLNLDKRIPIVALSHHERCNGSGYPSGLKSNEISDYAKIIAIADVYDAMTAKRVYRGPICPFEVISIFEKEGYDLYEPKYLLPFLKNVVNSYLHNTVRLNNGEIGEVIMINQLNLSSPVIRTENAFIDLSRQKSLRIEAIL